MLLILESLNQIERFKTKLVKRAPGLPKNSSSTLDLPMSGERTFLEELIEPNIVFEEAPVTTY